VRLLEGSGTASPESGHRSGRHALNGRAGSTRVSACLAFDVDSRAERRRARGTRPRDEGRADTRRRAGLQSSTRSTRSRPFGYSPVDALRARRAHRSTGGRVRFRAVCLAASRASRANGPVGTPSSRANSSSGAEPFSGADPLRPAVASRSGCRRPRRRRRRRPRCARAGSAGRVDRGRGSALIWVWMISWPLDHQGTKGLAEAESRPRSTDAAVLLAAIASLAAIALALVRASSNQDPVAITQVVLSVLAVTLSWALVNTDRRCRARSWARRHGTPRAARRPRHTGAQRAAPGRRRRRGLRRLPGAGARPGGVVRVPLVRPSTHPGRVTRRSIRRRLGSAGGRSSGTAPLPARTPHTSWCREPQPRTRACSTGTAPPRAGW
jgi:hypothetical protein